MAVSVGEIFADYRLKTDSFDASIAHVNASVAKHGQQFQSVTRSNTAALEAMRKNFKAPADSLDGLNGRLKTLQDRLNRASAGSAGFKKIAQDLDVVKVKIAQVNAAAAKAGSGKVGAGLTQGLTQAIPALGNMTSMVGGLGGAMGGAGLAAGAMTGGIAIAGAAAVAAGQKIISLGADLEQTRTGFRTLLKGNAEAADALVNSINRLANETPLLNDELLQAGKQMLAFQFNSADVPDTLRIIGDVASGLKQPLGEMVFLYGQMKTQGKAMAGDLLQFAGRGVPIYEELGKVMGVPAEQIKDLASKGKIGFAEIEKVFQNMTAKGGMFFGSMAEQAKTFNGLVSSLTGAGENFLARVGEAALPILKPFVIVFNDLISAGHDILDAFGDIGSAIGPVGDGFGDIMVWILPMTRQIKLMTLAFQGAAKMLRLLADGIRIAKVIFEDLSGSAKKANSSLTELASNMAGGAKNAIVNFFNDGTAAAQEFWDSLDFSQMVDEFLGTKDALKTFFQPLKEGWEAAKKEFAKGIEWIKEQWDNFRRLISNTFEPFVRAAEGAITKVIGMLQRAWSAIAAWWARIMARVRSATPPVPGATAPPGGTPPPGGGGSGGNLIKPTKFVQDFFSRDLPELRRLASEGAQIEVKMNALMKDSERDAMLNLLAAGDAEIARRIKVETRDVSVTESEAREAGLKTDIRGQTAKLRADARAGGVREFEIQADLKGLDESKVAEFMNRLNAQFSGADTKIIDISTNLNEQDQNFQTLIDKWQAGFDKAADAGESSSATVAQKWANAIQKMGAEVTAFSGWAQAAFGSVHQAFTQSMQLQASGLEQSNENRVGQLNWLNGFMNAQHEREVKAVEAAENEKIAILRRANDEKKLILDEEYNHRKSLLEQQYLDQLAADQIDFDQHLAQLRAMSANETIRMENTDIMEEDFRLLKEQREREHQERLDGLRTEINGRKEDADKETDKKVVAAEQSKEEKLAALQAQREEREKLFRKAIALMNWQTEVQATKLRAEAASQQAISGGLSGAAQTFSGTMAALSIIPFVGPFIAPAIAGAAAALVLSNAQQQAQQARAQQVLPPLELFFAKGGSISRGGVGSETTDDIAARLSRGETVLTAGQTQAIIDAGRTREVNSFVDNATRGNSVVNFHNTFNLPEGTTVQQVNDISAILERQIRQRSGFVRV